MNRNESEAILNLHRAFRPRRRTGRGFLTGTVFLDTALLVLAFILLTSPFVLKPGITLDLPTSSRSGSIRFNDMVLQITQEGLLFFNDEQVQPDRLESALRTGAEQRPDAALILEADRNLSQSDLTEIYDAAAIAGFEKIFIATQRPATETP
jgi:biopolymer transport protein ExbD